MSVVEEGISVGVDPEEYFKNIKEQKRVMEQSELLNIYNSCIFLYESYKITGQEEAIKKLVFYMDTILNKEMELLKIGVNTYVYKDDIESYIEKVSSRVVKIIDLKHYEREIPGEIVDVIAKTKNIFDEFYIVFTDYTGKVEKRVSEDRRRKDPILFGVFKRDIGTQNETAHERFYFLGDWEDEYCDLTLDRMVIEMKELTSRDIEHGIKFPQDLDQVKLQLDNIIKESGAYKVSSKKDTDRKSLFGMVRTFLQRGKGSRKRW